MTMRTTWVGIGCFVSCLAPVFASASDWPAERLGPKAAWEKATDPATQTRFIPMQLVVPGVWDGSRRIDLPPAGNHDAEGTTWNGPAQWRHPGTGKDILAYDRSRNNRREGLVTQKMALRTDGVAIGRVYDSRSGWCDEEAKFPLGNWQQGEVRTFEYTCQGSGTRPERRRVARITIEEIDYEHNGVPHSLRFAWRYTDAAGGEVLDHRTYIFSPGRGLVGHARR
jgi:hypothetical protein